MVTMYALLLSQRMLKTLMIMTIINHYYQSFQYCQEKEKNLATSTILIITQIITEMCSHSNRTSVKAAGQLCK